MSEQFKNFGMMIPLDILRFGDGTPMIASTQEEKVKFTEWCEINMPNINALSKQEIQGIFKYWKQIKK